MPPRQIYASMASRHERRWSHSRRRRAGWVPISLVALAGVASWLQGLIG